MNGNNYYHSDQISREHMRQHTKRKIDRKLTIERQTQIKSARQVDGER